ncbi:velum formation-related protein [Recurvomyces mirabilis]|uniref:Velum formation-related protein n=1 Tax=Recurvomyces mirabilis TaxID=574656 RepID=A0AAE0TRD4_9PEZI|nr:velum formation-related protein [Recurvomyces mirabilis]KAK5155401.1 velum formation- protein [Recurvomyces mirabilis]
MSTKGSMESREPDNVTTSRTTRVTKDGKTLNYHLKVIQQPERARACGAGAKSSADRRPVDPPPIVELRIFDGAAPDTDITFSMNANYFLFATLEQARVIAHGRVPESKQQLTVLTGTPVAGMVYLDRPIPAGYFIFPDLSVRHEGKYRLSFSLYEELKDVGDDDGTGAASSGDAHVTHRLEVKSEPFNVFSAKKFPGLTESTSLSRVVAEQGCRVRIRRDVRMRRRDTKASGKDWGDYEDETAEARAHASVEPDSSTHHIAPEAHGRPRSSSNASLHSLPLPLSRRESQELGQAYSQPFGNGPNTPQHAYASTSAYGPSPTQSYQPPPFMSQPSMQPPPLQYGAHHAYAPLPPPTTSQVPSPSVPTYSHGYPSYAPHSQAPPPSEYGYRGSIDSLPSASIDSRRHSSQFSIAPPPPAYPISRPSYPIPAPIGQPHHAQSLSHGSQEGFMSRIPPPQPMEVQTRASGATTPLSAPHSLDKLSVLPFPPPPSHFNSNDPLEADNFDGPFSAAPLSATEGRKRLRMSYDQVGAQKSGTRADELFPTGSHSTHDESDYRLRQDGGPNLRTMSYNRANGTSTTRTLETM